MHLHIAAIQLNSQPDEVMMLVFSRLHDDDVAVRGLATQKTAWTEPKVVSKFRAVNELERRRQAHPRSECGQRATPCAVSDSLP